jgi:putative ABC transport system ATP-binding protein
MDRTGNENDDRVVAVRGVTHAYGQRETAITVLKGVEFSLKRGELIVLSGPSGSGKTTLLTLIGCLRSLQAGEIELLGWKLAGADEIALASMRRNLGFVFQAHNLHRSLTALENVRMGLEVLGRTAMNHWQESCTHALALVGLDSRRDARPDHLSGGQKQRVAVARAIVGNPDLILADEPTAALDKDNGKRVVELFRNMADLRGTSVILVTHDHRIMDYGDRIVRMEEGRVACG